MRLTVVTEDNVYQYFKENEIEFIKNQLDDRAWIRLPEQVVDTQTMTDFTGKKHEVDYQQSKIIPRSRIIEISQTDKIIKY